MQLATKSVSSIESTVSATDQQPGGQGSGLLIINADDWGRDRANTDRTLDCIRVGAVSSVSAMMFMEDSERSAAIAREQGIDAGLHLNFTTPFSAVGVPIRLAEHQQRIARYLLSNRFAQVMFHPGLVQSFEYVVAYQLAEFVRLYGVQAQRIDGHHHMHLCANVVFGKLLPEGTMVRRNFSFRAGEKGAVNRLYREWIDARIARRHHLVDYFFSIEPLEPAERLVHTFSYARQSVVEIETHPVRPDEYRFLQGGGISRVCDGLKIASEFKIPLLTPTKAWTTERHFASIGAERHRAAKAVSSVIALAPTVKDSRQQRGTVVVGFAEAAAAVEVVWSLVDAGYHVIAFGRKGRSCALRHSRHVVWYEICPPESGFESSISDLRSLLSSLEKTGASSTRFLLPLDDKAVLLCSKAHFDESWTLTGPVDAQAELALNKYLQIQVAQMAGFNVPKTCLVRSEEGVRSFVASESYPVILKSAECVPIEAGRAMSYPHWICGNNAELENALQQWRERIPLLAQPFILGTGEGLFGLAAADGVRAWSAHRRLRMMNPQGSGSSACISQSVSEDLKCKADSFIRQTGWRGMFMIELLRDASGKVFFVEFNGRPWGSMALSRRQHLEYPAWQVMLAAEPQSKVGLTSVGEPGMLSRHAGRELMHLLFVLRGPKSKALTAWPSAWGSAIDVLQIGRGETLYNWRSEDRGVFFADLYYTIKSNLLKGAH